MTDNRNYNPPSTPQAPPTQQPTSQQQQQAPTQAAPQQQEAQAPREEIDPAVRIEGARSMASVGRKSLRDDLFDPNIVAKPLGGGDGFFNLRPKNPAQIILRGICHIINMRDGSPSHLRYEQAKAQGYVNATPADIDGPVPATYLRENGTKIVNADLILMKIDRNLYRGALKFKDQQAINATRRLTTVDQAKSEVRKSMQETNVPSNLSRKLSVFSPSNEELRKDFGDNEQD